jgi:hypothetical protein
MKELGKIKTLKLVNVTGCKKVSKSGTTALKLALPKVTIEMQQ